MKPKRKDWWIDAALGVACLVILVLIVHRVQVRASGENHLQVQDEPTSTSPVQEGDAALPQLDFDLLQRVEPRRNAQGIAEPVFSPGMAALDGKRVQMQGFMGPYESLQDMREFMLFNFPVGCNFCVPPAVNQVVLIRQRTGKNRYPFIDAPIQVTGTLRLWREDSEDPAHENVMFIYVMEDVEVVPVKMDPIQLERFHREHAAQGQLPGI